MKGIETERRFLIRMPQGALLRRLGGDMIEQIYITPSEVGTTERVRARAHGGVTVYTHTVKRRTGAISAEEDECVISEDEYRALAANREDGTSVIKKTRYVMPYRGSVFEIDVYPEWTGIAVMEVELSDESDDVALPPEIDVIREVSGDRTLSNHALSRKFPAEEELTFEK